MEIPGLNPAGRQPIAPQQQGVPDLILDVPKRSQQSPLSQSIAPHQAPQQAVVQHNLQSLTHALTEMNIPPTAQNIQIAQSLVNYGLPVNQASMQFVQQMLAHMPDKSAATVEAIVVLMANDKAVSPESVRAMKQLMNGQALPEQLQHLQKDLSQLANQLRSPQAQAQLQQEVKVSQAILQNTQMGAATNSAVQQSAGQAQVIENRVDGQLKLQNQTTAEKIQQIESAPKQVQATDAKAENTQKQANVQNAQPLPQQGSQRELEALHIHLNKGDNSEDILDQQKMIQENRLKNITPEQLTKAFVRQLLELNQLLEQLTQQMTLRNFNNLATQQGQLVQLVGILQYKLNEFREMFKKLFPDLSYQALEEVDLAGMDMFSRLAHLIDEGNDVIRAQLKYAAQGLTAEQMQSAIRAALEQIGVAIEMLHAHLGAREILVPNQQALVIPFAVSANGELYPAELKIEYDQERSRSEDGEVPTKISLTLETKTLGRVGVSLSSLKKDLSINLKVVTRRVKLMVEERLDQLQNKLEKESFQVSYVNCRVEPDFETRQSMLIPPRQRSRSLRRVEGIV